MVPEIVSKVVKNPRNIFTETNRVWDPEPEGL
jgi:hypothetical protein